MDRKKFIGYTILGLGAASASPVLAVSNSHSTYDKLIDQVGFNHLPNNEQKTMKTVLHKANTRGHANHGWLDTHHSFSFANYYNPERMNFGVLRVLNDDIVEGGKGFATHPHDNMEIISIPLKGGLEHKDSMGNTHVIKRGEIQVMSAGTGIFHSEYNKDKTNITNFLQIWLFPMIKNVEPRYDQITLDAVQEKNKLYQILSPAPDDAGVWIHQDAWFHMGNLDKETELDYNFKGKNTGAYVFVIGGAVTIDDQPLDKRDGFGLWDISSFHIKADSEAEILIMEVPMYL